MSYEIIKGIRIEDGKLMIKSDSNNVSPRYFSWSECPSLTKLLKEQGKDALELEIFKQYVDGNFQAHGNKDKYTRALQVLRHMPEYKKYDWHTNWEEYKKNKDDKGFNDLLKKALKTMLPKDIFIVKKEDENSFPRKMVYLEKTTKRSASWTYSKNKAKIYRYKEEAERLKTYFIGGEEFIVEKVVKIIRKPMQVGNLGILEVGDKSEMIRNTFSGEEIELCPEAVAVHDLVKGAEVTGESETVQSGIAYFSEHWPNEYMVLLD